MIFDRFLIDFWRLFESTIEDFWITFSKQRFHENEHPYNEKQNFQGLEAAEIDQKSYITKVWIFYRDLSIMLRLNWQDNFKFPTQRLSQIMRDFGLRVICLIRLKIILPSLNLFLGADKSISVMKLRNKWFLAKLHSFIGVCKISYIKHVLSTKKSPLQLSASS